MATRQRICRIRVLAKNSPFLANLSIRQNGLFGKLVGLDRLADIRQAVLRGLARLAENCQVMLRGLARLAHICQRGLLGLERWVWQVFCKFSESGESGKFGECRLDHFMQIKYVICAKNDLSYHARLRQHLPMGLASTRQTRRHSLTGFIRTRQTRRHSPTCFARTR
jgi:hypothetical protein